MSKVDYKIFLRQCLSCKKIFHTYLRDQLVCTMVTSLNKQIYKPILRGGVYYGNQEKSSTKAS